jgi:hypothetical protein
MESPHRGANHPSVEPLNVLAIGAWRDRLGVTNDLWSVERGGPGQNAARTKLPANRAGRWSHKPWNPAAFVDLRPDKRTVKSCYMCAQHGSCGGADDGPWRRSMVCCIPWRTIIAWPPCIRAIALMEWHEDGPTCLGRIRATKCPLPIWGTVRANRLGALPKVTWPWR